MEWPRRKTDAAWVSLCEANKDAKEENVRSRLGVTEGMKSFSGEGSSIRELESKCCSKSGVSTVAGCNVVRYTVELLPP